MQRHPSDLPPTLVELAAGRDPGDGDLDAQLVSLAREHRVAGLLWSWARGRDVDPEYKTQLAMYDLYAQAHLARVWSVLETSVARLAEIGISVATIKGVTAEARWYERTGERPCSDVDLLLAPDQLDRVADVVAALQPDHPWLPHVAAMAASGRVQSVTLWVEGIEVDIHLDLLKLGVPTRQTGELWERTDDYRLRSGGTVRVLDDTAALFHLLLHLNKDRFQRLQGYADVPRIMAAGRVDWTALLDLARGEGVEVSMLCTLEAVLGQLGLAWPAAVARPRGPRSIAWRALWRPSVRLRGREGRLRFRRRQDWIALLARGRSVEAVVWWLREILPPAPAVQAHYGHIRGPYLWKLARGRTEAVVAHSREVANVRERRAGATRDRSNDTIRR